MPSGLNLGEKVVVTGGTGSEPSETAFVSEDATPPSTDVNKPVDKTVFGKRDRPNGDHRDALRGVTVKTTTGENGNWTVHAPPSAFKPGDKNSAVDGAVNKSTVTVVLMPVSAPLLSPVPWLESGFMMTLLRMMVAALWRSRS